MSFKKKKSKRKANLVKLVRLDQNKISQKTKKNQS